MKKRVIGFISFLLLLGLIGVIIYVFVDKKDSVPSDSDTAAVDSFDSDTAVVDSSGSNNSTDSGSNTETVESPYKSVYTLEDFSPATISRDSDGDGIYDQHWIGVAIGDTFQSKYRLKSNTQYKVSWRISDQYKSTGAYIPSKEIDGEMRYYISMTLGEMDEVSQDAQYSGTLESTLLDCAAYFTTEDPCDLYAIRWFMYDTSDTGKMYEVREYLMDYIVSLTVEEVIS